MQSTYTEKYRTDTVISKICFKQKVQNIEIFSGIKTEGNTKNIAVIILVRVFDWLISPWQVEKMQFGNHNFDKNLKMKRAISFNKACEYNITFKNKTESKVGKNINI